jgi:hypothetical protein
MSKDAAAIEKKVAKLEAELVELKSNLDATPCAQPPGLSIAAAKFRSIAWRIGRHGRG